MAFEDLVCRNEFCFVALLVSIRNGIQIFAEWPA